MGGPLVRRVVAAWIGGLGDGGSKGHGVAVSFDGGQTWFRLAIPGLTDGSGGTFGGAADPWLSFASNGDLYHTALVSVLRTQQAVDVGRSVDGGLSWIARIPLAVWRITPPPRARPRSSRAWVRGGWAEHVRAARWLIECLGLARRDAHLGETERSRLVTEYGWRVDELLRIAGEKGGEDPTARQAIAEALTLRAR